MSRQGAAIPKLPVFQCRPRFRNDPETEAIFA
jgi:hypothetical protein